jgi:hypothetical protein
MIVPGVPPLPQEPDKLIEQMKELGIYGLAIPGPWGQWPCFKR